MQNWLGAAAAFVIGFGLCYLTLVGREKKLMADVARMLEAYGKGNVLQEMEQKAYGSTGEVLLKPLSALRHTLKNWVHKIVHSSSIISTLTLELNNDSHASLK